MTDPLWLPDGVRTAKAETLFAPGSTVFLTANAFGYWTPRNDPHGRPRVPAVEVVCDHLRDQCVAADVLQQRLEPTEAGVTSGLGTDPDHMDEFADGPKLLIEHGEVTYLIGPISGAPMDWYPELMNGFAVIFPALADGHHPNIVTAPLVVGEHQPEPPAAPEPAEPRQERNEPCRCGSGKKAKRCCGA